MEKQRGMRLSIVLAMIALAAVFGYILLGNMRSGEQKINITLPSGIQSGADVDEGGALPVLDTNLTKVEITTDNVQAVIKSLVRPTDYHLTMTVTNHYEDLVRTRTVDHWVSGANAHTRTVSSGGVQTHELRWDENVYLWSGGSETYAVYPVGDFSADASAGMLTYEDVSSIPKAQIAAAEYKTYEQTPCIYIAAKDDALGYLSEYYISLNTGMLIFGAIHKDTALIYSMTVTDLTEGVFDETVFILPDGKSPVGA